MTDIADLIGFEDDGKPLNRRSKKARKSLGDLHVLLTEKLPDLVDPQSQVCDLHQLAKKRGMSFQGVYKWFKDHDENRLPYPQAMWLIELSEKQRNKPAGFKALTFEDIREFITSS